VRVLITGMSGVGKSALLHELARRGYRTVDTDYGDYHETVDGEQLWREDRIAALLADDGPLFVQGTTRNQVVFYPLFDHIVLLSAPADVLVERLTTRTTNPYGKDPAEVAETLDYLETVEPYCGRPPPSRWSPRCPSRRSPTSLWPTVFEK
jgi:dephospho-CoA kinase